MLVARPTRRLAFVVAASITVAACGGSDDASPGSVAPVGTEPVAAAAVDMSDLEVFGDLVGAASDPVVAEFDSAGGELDLGDGATVAVPPGAFADVTALSAQTVELEFGRFVDAAPNGRVYVLSTVDEVDLGEPVELVVAVPTDNVGVVQSIDGEWRPVAVPAGGTTRIPIAHFSTVSTAVVERRQTPPVPTGDDPTEAPAAFLTTCALTLTWTFGDYDPDEDRVRVDDFSLSLALQICTRALVDRLTPTGERVDLACVNDRVGGDTGLQAAIDACLSDRLDDADGEPAAGSTGPPATDVVDDTVVVVEGEVTAGPVVEGANAGPTVVTDNGLEFVLAFGDGVVTGEGVVDREVDGSNENCRDRYTSPLSFDFDGSFTDEEATIASGTFDWRVDEGRFVQIELEQLGDTECPGRTSFASGAGEWTATWDGAARTFVGSMTFPGGLGANTFELAATTTISAD